MKSLYCAPNKLRSTFVQCSAKVTLCFMRAMQMYACQL